MAFITLPLTEDDTDTRIDRWLKRRYPGLRQGDIEKMLRKGVIKVDGKKVTSSFRLESGFMVRMPEHIDYDTAQKPKQSTHEPLPQNWILKETPDFMVINKPYGIASQGGTNTKRHIDGMLGALTESTGIKYHLIHRLDKDTAGIMVVAKSVKSAQLLAQAFKERSIQKTYLAVVLGYPPQEEGTLKLAIRKGDGRYGEQMVVDEVDGLSAITHYRIVDRLGLKATLLELKPHTGRTHQLRVHCQAMGCPILGDSKYGDMMRDLEFHEVDHSEKLHLWARTLDLPAPWNLTITGPTPPHFQETLKFLGLGE